MTANEYIEFLDHRHALDVMLGINAEDRMLLETIAIYAMRNEPMSVTQVMELSHIASSATMHRKLDHLRFLGLIRQHRRVNNRRSKFIIPTKRAMTYFSRVGAAIQGEKK